ncbi:uncharacterized protein [Anabrus simplex]|uniref:uncharacterized protein n=1 Tax=Anabrus simplex TaxID=316456 RepID=UPI0035A2B34D
MDLEVKIKEEPICFEETSNTLCCEMGKEIEIKEEPVWLEGTASTSFPPTDIKNEICVDEQTDGQLVGCFKEEDNARSVEVIYRLYFHTLFKMDLEVMIKQEPISFEETSNTSCFVVEIFIFVFITFYLGLYSNYRYYVTLGKTQILHIFN